MEPNSNPPVNPVLVEWLQRVFPDKCPSPTDTEREIWMAVGRAEVVRKIAALSAEQSQTVLPPEQG